MKILPSLALVILLPTFCLAGDWEQKDSKTLAAESSKMAMELKKQALDLEARALAEERKLSADEKKFVELTHEESLALEKAAGAWEKNQKRLAEKFRKEAYELCEKRGPLAEKVYAQHKKPVKEGPHEKKSEPKPEDLKAKKLAEIEKQQAELEAKKKALLNSTSPVGE
jgi:uncharacterized protein YifE (UPF0438 family)